MSSVFFRCLERWGPVEKGPARTSAIMANGSKATVIAEVTVPAEIGGKVVRLTASVLDGLGQELLLGMQFLRQHRVVIHPHSSRVEWTPVAMASTGPKSSTPSRHRRVSASELNVVRQGGCNGRPDRRVFVKVRVARR
jgi:hypothetical protein